MRAKNFIRVVAVVYSLLAGFSIEGFAALNKEQRLADFHQLVSIIERNYAPLQWKAKTVNLDWNREVQNFREKIANATSDAKFYQTLSQFISTLQDAHVSSQVPSTYRASLGFLCDYIEGKVLIEAIDPLRLPEMLFPFKKGDQLLSIGGIAVEQLMAELSLVNNTGHKPSQDRIAAAKLTTRREATGLAIPRGVTTITVLPKGASQPVTVTATWITRGVPVMELDDLSKVLDGSTLAAILPASAEAADFLSDLKKLPIFNMKLPQAKLQDWALAGVQDIGSPISMFELPASAEKIKGVPITAAIYQAGGKRIGVIRVPVYDTEDLLKYIAIAAKKMETDTDVLVLDQTNNPGGSVSLVSDITSIFADKSFVDMNFYIRPSLNWVNAFAGINQQLNDMLAEDPQDIGANALKARFEYLEQEMRDSLQEKRYLSNPVSLDLGGRYGMILPQPTIRYTKPILMLINEFDFSGGDAFPAIMKDNGRVTLFGARTSGAGGNVAEYGPLANSYFKFHLTESLMVRPNGQLMENLGVSPDIEYKVTEADFMNKYRDYVISFTTEALKLAGVNASKEVVSADFEKQAEEAAKKLEEEAKKAEKDAAEVEEEQKHE